MKRRSRKPVPDKFFTNITFGFTWSERLRLLFGRAFRVQVSFALKDSAALDGEPAVTRADVDPWKNGPRLVSAEPKPTEAPGG